MTMKNVKKNTSYGQNGGHFECVYCCSCAVCNVRTGPHNTTFRRCTHTHTLSNFLPSEVLFCVNVFSQILFEVFLSWQNYDSLLRNTSYALYICSNCVAITTWQWKMWRKTRLMGRMAAILCVCVGFLVQCVMWGPDLTTPHIHCFVYSLMRSSLVWMLFHKYSLNFSFPDRTMIYY